MEELTDVKYELFTFSAQVLTMKIREFNIIII